jgi:hypothetical protein
MNPDPAHHPIYRLFFRESAAPLAGAQAMPEVPKGAVT